MVRGSRRVRQCRGLRLAAISRSDDKITLGRPIICRPVVGDCRERHGLLSFTAADALRVVRGRLKRPGNAVLAIGADSPSSSTSASPAASAIATTTSCACCWPPAGSHHEPPPNVRRARNRRVSAAAEAACADVGAPSGHVTKPKAFPITT